MPPPKMMISSLMATARYPWRGLGAGHVVFWMRFHFKLSAFSVGPAADSILKPLAHAREKLTAPLKRRWIVMASPKTDSSDSSSLHEDSDSSSLHEEDPSTRPEVEPSQWRSGYDCQFVGEQPGEGECPICHLIYRHPYQMRCGKRICKECVEKIKAKSQPCPFCKEVDVTSFPDVAHMQYLGCYNVNCPNRSEGCEWEGQLADLDRHLNLEPTTEKQLKGCPFSRIKCRFCFELFERHFIDAHQSRECLKRPYECEYCEYSATFEEVTQQHSNECPSAPVTCPNNCELVVFRSDLEHHRNHDCPLEMQQCEFRAVGCQIELPRRDMPEHKRQSVAEHSVALSTTLQRAMADSTTLQGDITSLQGDITSLQGKMQALIANNEQTTGAMQDSLNAMKDSLNAMQDAMRDSLNDMRGAMRDGQNKMQKRITAQSTSLCGVVLLAIVIVSIAVLAGVVTMIQYREDHSRDVCIALYNLCNRW